MMVSLCSQYWQLVLAQGVVVGLGGGCLFVPSIAILPTYFSTHMAFTIGIAGSGSGIGKITRWLWDTDRVSDPDLTVVTGGVIYPIVFQELENIIGFAWATRVIAFVMLATLSVPLAVMRPRLKPSAVRKLFDSAAWSERPYSFFAFGGFFGFIGMYLPLYYISVFAIAHGMSPRLAFYLIPILNAGSIFGRILPNVSGCHASTLLKVLILMGACEVRGRQDGSPEYIHSDLSCLGTFVLLMDGNLRHNGSHSVHGNLRLLLRDFPDVTVQYRSHSKPSYGCGWSAHGHGLCDRKPGAACRNACCGGYSYTWMARFAGLWRRRASHRNHRYERIEILEGWVAC